MSLLINAVGAINPAAPVFIKLRRFIIIQKIIQKQQFP
jgi:hypothetical protein